MNDNPTTELLLCCVREVLALMPEGEKKEALKERYAEQHDAYAMVKYGPFVKVNADFLTKPSPSVENSLTAVLDEAPRSGLKSCR